MDKLQQQQLKEMEAHLQALSHAGHEEEAKAARAEYDEALRHLEVEGRMHAREVEHEEKAVALELRLAELELEQAMRLGEGDEKGVQELGKEVMRLSAEMRSLDLDRLKLEMERAEAELQLRREQYERVAQQLKEAGTDPE